MKQFKYGFLFLMIFLSACSEPQSFEFKGLQDIQLDKLTMGKNKIRANVKYYNPNAFSLVLKQIDCKVLLNNGNRNFTFLQAEKSGIQIIGETRDIKQLQIMGKPSYLFVQNNSAPIVYQFNSK